MSYIEKIQRLQALKAEIETSRLPDLMMIPKFKEAVALTMELVIIMNCGGVNFDNEERVKDEG